MDTPDACFSICYGHGTGGVGFVHLGVAVRNLTVSGKGLVRGCTGRVSAWLVEFDAAGFIVIAGDVDDTGCHMDLFAGFGVGIDPGPHRDTHPFVLVILHVGAVGVLVCGVNQVCAALGMGSARLNNKWAEGKQ